jgi:Ca-activated chloride channel family protein
VSGRHRSYAAQGGASFPTGIVLGVSALVVTAGAAGWVTLSHHTGCGSTTTLSVAAAPDIAPTITRLAAATHFTCGTVTVTSIDPATVAAALSSAAARPGSTPAQPDVWIPDTSLWLTLARAGQNGADNLPANGVTIATSPTVIAMPRPVAQALGWPANTQLGWQTLLSNEISSQPLRIAMPDPASNGVALAALTTATDLTIAAAGTDPAAQQQAKEKLAGVLHGLSYDVPATVTDLLRTLPTTETTTLSRPGIAAFPDSEQSVLSYNTAQPAPAVPLVAIYPQEGSLPLDYPYVRLDGLGGAQQHLADQLLAAIRGGAGHAALLAAGFRDPAGTPGPRIDSALGLDPAVPPGVSLPNPVTPAEALGIWQNLHRAGRMLVVVDVSGTMGDVVPGTSETRLAMTLEAARRGLALFNGGTSVGLWTFTTTLTDGAAIRRELIAPGPLDGPLAGTSRRQALLNALNTIVPRHGLANGLYQTLLAAYQQQEANYDPSKLNSVIVFTDGLDENLNAISTPRMIAELRQLRRPGQQVPIYIVALGQGVELSTLTQVAAVTGGAALYTPTPDQADEVLLRALASQLPTTAPSQ